MKKPFNSQVIADNKISNSEQRKCKLLANVKENLSKLVQRRLKELDIKKAELARRTGLSRTYITDIANATGNTASGQYIPSPEVIEKLALGLQVEQSEVLNAIYNNGTQATKQITTVMDLLIALEDLGIKGLQMEGGYGVFENMSIDELQDTFERMKLDLKLKAEKLN